MHGFPGWVVCEGLEEAMCEGPEEAKCEGPEEVKWEGLCWAECEATISWTVVEMGSSSCGC